jgi:hypothetical protein
MVSRRRGGGDGPLWTRAFKREAEDGPSKKALRSLLAGYGTKRVVVGHAPTRDGEIVLDHPRYDGAVVLIDTRISDARRGRMSALEIRGDALAPIYAEDRGTGRMLEELAEAALRTGPADSAWRRAQKWIVALFKSE